MLANLVHPIDSLGLDSLQPVLGLPDTIKVLSVNPSADPTQFWLPIIVVVTGGAITLFINYLVSGWQATKNLEKELFSTRVKAYAGIGQALSRTYHVTIKNSDGQGLSAFPSAYLGYETLKKWNSETTELVDQNLFLLDQETYRVFDDFNHLILDHLAEVESCGLPEEQWDRKCRDIGRKNVGAIQEKNARVIAAARGFIKRKYSIELETVR